MNERPIGSLVRCLQNKGVNIKCHENEYPPVLINGND